MMFRLLAIALIFAIPGPARALSRVRRPPPCPSARFIIERMVEEAGMTRRRWSSVRTIAQYARIELLDRRGDVRKHWNESTFFAKCGGHPRLLVVLPRNGKTLAFACNGHDYWVTVDERPSNDPRLLEEAARRVRETLFWMRFPFILLQDGTEAEVAGSRYIDGGRKPVWLLDVLPATTGDGWPLGRIRLLVDQNNYRLDGVEYPYGYTRYSGFHARFSNYIRTNGLLNAHLREISDEEGPAAREIIQEKFYNRPLPQSIFEAPVFYHYRPARRMRRQRSSTSFGRPFLKMK